MVSEILPKGYTAISDYLTVSNLKANFVLALASFGKVTGIRADDPSQRRTLDQR